MGSYYDSVDLTLGAHFSHKLPLLGGVNFRSLQLGYSIFYMYEIGRV